MNEKKELNKAKLFWQVYESLEKELLAMRDFVQFDDNNLQAYSINLATFIQKCNSEIESLIKEIYARYFPEEISKKISINKRLKKVTSELQLEEKILYLNYEKFYFSEEKMKNIKPLKYRDVNGDNLTRIYNAIKHDRVNSLDKATLEVAINNLAFLYLLNLYFGYELYPPLYFDYSSKMGLGDSKSKFFRVRTTPYVLMIFMGLRDKETPILDSEIIKDVFYQFPKEPTDLSSLPESYLLRQMKEKVDSIDESRLMNKNLSFKSVFWENEDFQEETGMSIHRFSKLNTQKFKIEGLDFLQLSTVP